MKARNLGIAVVAVLGLWLLYSSLVFVDETEYVLILQFGEHKHTVSDPGLTFKVPFTQNAIRVEKRILASDAPAEEYLTQDKKRLLADPITRWRVVDPLKFYTSVGNEEQAARRIDDLVLSELREELARRTMSEMVGSKRGPMMDSVTERVRENAQSYGIEIVDVRIKALDLPQEVQRSVFDRMVAERERLAKGYRAQGQEESDKITSLTDREQKIILADATRQADKLRGEGDAQATKIYAEVYGQDPEFYTFVRSLEAYEKSVGKDATIVMSTRSQLFRYLSKPGKPGAAVD